MNFLKFLVFAFLIICSTSSYAACSNPVGQEGQQFYNSSVKNMQFCNGTDWMNMAVGAFSGGGGLTLGSVVSPSSGANIDFTGIPSGTKRITIQFANLNHTGEACCTADDMIIQLGDSGGLETTGYIGSAENPGVEGSQHTTDFVIDHTGGVVSGIATLAMVDASTNEWSFSSLVGTIGATEHTFSIGHKSLSDALSQIRIRSVGGGGNFVSGKVNILYE